MNAKSIKSFATETEITAVAISKDDNFIANASYDKSNNTISLWNYSINSDTFDYNGSVKIDLKEKVPLNDKVDLTISKLIPSSNSRFIILSYLSKKRDSSEDKAVLIVLQLENESNKVELEDVVIKSRNDLNEAKTEAKTEAVSIKSENDTDEIKPAVVTINSENNQIDKAKTVLEESEELQLETGLDKA